MKNTTKLHHILDVPRMSDVPLMWFFDLKNQEFFAEVLDSSLEWKHMGSNVLALGWQELEEPTEILMQRLAEIRQEQLEERDYVQEMTRHTL